MASIAKGDPVEKFAGAGFEIFDFLDAVCVAKRKHREAVLDLTERLVDFATDPTSRRGGKREFGILSFQIDKFAQERIKLEVADDRVVVHVVFVVVIVDETGEFSDALASAFGSRSRKEVHGDDDVNEMCIEC